VTAYASTVDRCPGCGYQFGTRPSCEVTEIVIRGHSYERIRYVPRGAWERAEFPDRCPNCEIRRGCFHHVGCELEMCPACEGQLTECGCEYYRFSPGLR
jgi:hypothetical protein